MYNPFSSDPSAGDTDRRLVQAAIEGDRHALEVLINRHQAWIYNIALRMVWNPLDAEDVTQEVLLKIITKLSTFRGESEFRTWVYRIVANHVINMKRRSAEKKFISFDQYWADIDGTPDQALPDQSTLPVDLSMVLEEIRIHCMMGMLLCLDRRRRLVFILGELLDVGDRIGSNILEISRVNFRQILSRSRKQVYSFMKNKCGLVDPDNPCHCQGKAQGMIDDGEIDPQKFQFNVNYRRRLRHISEVNYNRLKNLQDSQCKALFKEQPFQEPPDYTAALREMLYSDDFQALLDPSS